MFQSSIPGFNSCADCQGIHAQGEYINGIIDNTCENHGCALDSLDVREFLVNQVIPVVEDSARPYWLSLIPEADC
jgi:hypothetical protein